MSSGALPATSRLSYRFAELEKVAQGHQVTLGQLMASLNERGHALLALFLVIPFLQPVPLPIVSTIFGLAVAAVGTQMALGKPPWLPQRLRRHQLATATLLKISGAARRLLTRFERLIRPRGRFIHENPGMRRLAGGVMAIGGVLLSLPLPVPVSHFLPALAVALVALEEDGLVVVAGFVTFVVACAFFVGLALLPVLGITGLRDLWHG